MSGRIRFCSCRCKQSGKTMGTHFASRPNEEGRGRTERTERTLSTSDRHRVTSWSARVRHAIPVCPERSRCQTFDSANVRLFRAPRRLLGPVRRVKVRNPVASSKTSGLVPSLCCYGFGIPLRPHAARQLFPSSAAEISSVVKSRPWNAERTLVCVSPPLSPSSPRRRFPAPSAPRVAASPASPRPVSCPAAAPDACIVGVTPIG